MYRLLFIIISLLVGLSDVMSKAILIVADEWEQMEVVEKYLHEKGGFVITKMEQNELPNSLSKYDGVIQFVHGMLNDEPARKMMEYTEEGGKLLVLHHGVSSKKKQTKGWYQFLGMELDRAEDSPKRYVWIKDIDFTMVNLNPNHFITSNKVTYDETSEYTSSDSPSMAQPYPSFTLKKSEIFLNHQFTDGREKTVLFGFKFKDPNSGKIWKQDRSGWYKQKDKGWLFYLQPGQIAEDFSPRYCQIIMNCFEWKP